MRVAGALVLAASTGRMLLLKRSRYVDEPGTWSVAAGAIRPGESARVAALRELREETGFGGPLYTVGRAERFRYGGLTMHYVEVITEEEFRPRLNWENTAYGWFSPDQLPEPLHPGFRAFILG